MFDPAGALRAFINATLDFIQMLVGQLGSVTGLTRPFSQLMDSVYPIVYDIHHLAVIPLAEIVLTVCFVVALLKHFTSVSAHDTGPDLMRVFMTFCMFALARILIECSFELMMAAYEYGARLTEQVLDIGTNTAVATGALGHVDDNVSDIGQLAFMSLASIIAWLAVIVVYLIAQMSVFGRAIQLYVFTALAPLPLAGALSEVTRPATTAFIKHYIALVLSGAILALLFVMMSAAAGAMIQMPQDPSSANWLVELLTSIGILIAFGIAMLRSGAWAKEIVGVG
jgi:hypothetical protein